MDFIFEKLKVPCQDINEMDAISILYEELSDGAKSIIGNRKFSLDEFLPWGFKMFSDLEEMKIELKTTRELKNYDSIIREDIKEFQDKILKLSQVYENFYLYLKKNALFTRALKYSLISEKITDFDMENSRYVYFVGFFSLTNSEKKIFENLAKRKNACFVFQEGQGLAEQFEFLGIKETNEKIKIPEKIHFYKTSLVHGEIFKLNEVIKKENFTSRDVVVLPIADALFPLICNSLGFANGNYNVSMGYPLKASPVYSMIDILFRLIDSRNESENKYFLKDYLKLVLHPYFKNIYYGKSGETTRIIFHTLEEFLSEQLSQYVKLEEIENNQDFLKQCVVKLEKIKSNVGVQFIEPNEKNLDSESIKTHISKIHDIAIRPFENVRNIGDFVEKILKFISFISEKSTALFHPYSAPFIEKIIGRVFDLKNSKLSKNGFENPSAYFKFFKSSIEILKYPFPGTPLKGLQVLGFLETRNIKFDTVYFLDANEGVIPSGKKEDSLLTYEIREWLGLGTHRTMEKIYRYYFSTLISGAKEVHLFYVDNPEREKSRYVEKLLWDIESETSKKENAKEIEVFFDINFAHREPPSVKKTEDMVKYLKTIQYSPSSLDDYLKCPLKFYYQSVLGLKETEDVCEDFEQADIGRIVHEVLDLFFKKKVGRKLSINKLDYKAMETLVEEVFKKHSSSTDGFSFMVRTQVKKRMRDLLDIHRQMISESKIDISIKDTEEFFDSARYGEIKLKGKIDRIEERDGLIYIIDYKTGSKTKIPNHSKFDFSQRDKWPITLQSVQLPFYILLYMAENREVSIDNINAGLMCLGTYRIEENFLFEDEWKEYKSKIFENYKKAIFSLIDEILSPEKDFVPTKDTENCSYCPFQTMCSR